MRPFRFESAVVLVMSFFCATRAMAAEPHLDLIRGLRAQGEPGLAMEYIQKRLTPAPPELAAVLGLETARTRVELALQETEESKRLAMFNQAKAEFEGFLAKNKDHPLAPQAAFEIARLIASQGKEYMSRGRRQDDKAAQKKSLNTARTMFADAATKLAAAAKDIQSKLTTTLANPTTPEDKATARELQQAYLQAQLEQGINLYQIAQTHGDNLKQRGIEMDKAIKVFEKLAVEDAKQPTCWIGRAWLGRCHANNQDFPKAKAAFDAVTGEKGPHVDAAQRIAGYFQLLMQSEENVPLQKLEGAAVAWMNRYRSFLNTPEGQGVRYFLASNLETQVEVRKGITRDKNGRPTAVTADADAMLGRAERLLRDLMDTENDFTQRAEQKRMRMILALAIRRAPDRNVAKLTSFETCYMLALLEIAEFNEDMREKKDDDPEKIAELKKARYAKVVRAVDRAIAVAKPTDPVKEVLDARYLQIFANLMVGNYPKAIEQGEALAKNQLRTSRGAVAALYALQGYRNQLTDIQSRGDVDEAEVRKIKDNIRRLAKHMEDTWKDATPTDSARHQLGSLLASEGDWLGALQAYSRVTPNYSALAYVRNEQGVACFNLVRAKPDGKKITAPVQADWFKRVTAELDRMPDLSQGAEGDTVAMYFLARLQLGNLLQQDGSNYKRVETIALDVADKVAKHPAVPERSRPELLSQAQSLAYYGLYGQIFQAMKTGDLGGAAKLYLPLLTKLKKPENLPSEDAVKVRKALSDVLQLALRSSVQEGVIDRAQEILKLLEATTAGQGAASGPLVQVLREVQLQINDLKKHNPEKLKETVERFSSFLDDLAKSPKVSNEVRLFLAQGYASLDQPGRAVDLLRAIPAPAPLGAAPKEPVDGSDEEKKKYDEAKTKYDADLAAHKSYWFAQLTQVRALRQLGRSDPKAGSANFDAAKKLLDEMIGTPAKKGWGFNSLEVRREQFFILEDRGLFRDALTQWNNNQLPFLKQMQGLMQEVNDLKSAKPDQRKPNHEELRQQKETQLQRVRQVVYEFHFYKIRCVYLSKQRNPTLAKDPKKKEEEYRKVAGNIVKVEKDPQTSDFGGEEVKKLYRDLLDDDDVLKAAYKQEGGTVLFGSGAAGAGQ